MLNNILCQLSYELGLVYKFAEWVEPLCVYRKLKERGRKVKRGERKGVMIDGTEIGSVTETDREAYVS